MLADGFARAPSPPPEWVRSLFGNGSVSETILADSRGGASHRAIAQFACKRFEKSGVDLLIFNGYLAMVSALSNGESVSRLSSSREPQPVPGQSVLPTTTSAHYWAILLLLAPWLILIETTCTDTVPSCPLLSYLPFNCRFSINNLASWRTDTASRCTGCATTRRRRCPGSPAVVPGTVYCFQWLHFHSDPSICTCSTRTVVCNTSARWAIKATSNENRQCNRVCSIAASYD